MKDDSPFRCTLTGCEATLAIDLSIHGQQHMLTTTVQHGGIFFLKEYFITINVLYHNMYLLVHVYTCNFVIARILNHQQHTTVIRT